MRDYGKISPQFWMGPTGRRLRAHGAPAQLVALYLTTCPHANMLGLYYLPVMYIAHETGLGMEAASAGLAGCIEAGFCCYDPATEMVWVREMAHYQIGRALSAADKRCAGAQNEYNALPDNPFLRPFFDLYRADFHLSRCRGAPAPGEAPCQALASHEQEQEQGHEQDQSKDQERGNPGGLPAAGAAGEVIDEATLPAAPERGRTDCPHRDIVMLYHELLPMCPRIRDWTPARQAQLRARWSEDAGRRTLDYWRRLFAYIAESRFLTGRAPSAGKPPFVASLDWIVKAENFAKIREGRYHKEAA